ncbi:MAG: polyribonucleotide nucleotidyltransferase [Deferribacteres bacterium]|nr:polyribonucleotide nucleotidyltransferase [Deferribacteres bacterium]
MGVKTVEREIAGRKLVIETGRVARQANGSVLVRYGDTMVLVTACCAEEPAEGLDFFPLTVEYRERAYAAGKIPGGFIKREGKPMESEILVSRLIDRPIRPLFPDGFRNEVQVMALVVSADEDNPADVPAIIGASAALSISEIPFEGPIAAVRIGMVDDELIVNPTLEQIENGKLNMVVAGTKDAIVMVEAGASEVSESTLIDALSLAHEEIKKIIEMEEELIAVAGKEKMSFEPPPSTEEYEKQIRERHLNALLMAIRVEKKKEREKALKSLKESILSQYPEEEQPLVALAFDKVEKEEMRRLILEEGIRADGRSPRDIRPITCEVGVLPRAHGSALFTRGETQALVAVTLGMPGEDEQILDELFGEGSKAFMVHYNFPPFSVGEVRPLRGPSRREIGHGALAERALKAVVPAKSEDFPYIVRVVSDILESNGSSSMATVCGGSLALMDAGVPIKKPVAGIAMGLIMDEKSGKYTILSDILGMEDHLGDMDFKVAGTEDGVTALQMDIKISGITWDIMAEALEQAKEGRFYILEKMKETLPAPRPEISPKAPRIVCMQIKPEFIRDVIGPGGKTIRAIIEKTGTKIYIDENGLVTVSAETIEGAKEALEIISKIAHEYHVGEVVKGKVKRIEDYGLFVEVAPGREGLLHISQISDRRIRDLKEEFQIGDEVEAKILEIDDMGRFRLTRRGLEGGPPEDAPDRSDRGPRRQGRSTRFQDKSRRNTRDR